MKLVLTTAVFALAFAGCTSSQTSDSGTYSETSKPVSSQSSDRPDRPERAEGGERPERGQGGERRGPPQEAFDACADKAENDSCAVVTPNETLEGTCRTPPRGDTSALLCVPANMPERR